VNAYNFEGIHSDDVDNFNDGDYRRRKHRQFKPDRLYYHDWFKDAEIISSTEKSHQIRFEGRLYWVARSLIKQQHEVYGLLIHKATFNKIIFEQGKLMETNKAIVIYCDGACSGNPGPGGWAANISGLQDDIIDICGGTEVTTNNIMELTAAIQGIRAVISRLKVPDREIKVFSDSEYLVKGMKEWLATWKRRNWKTANKSPVKNLELWKQLDSLNSSYEISWHWVKAHDGNERNERADGLANKMSQEWRENAVSC